MKPLRALPRCFLPGASAAEPIELPSDELEKFRKVLRLGTGDEVAILPNDGTVIRARLEGRLAIPILVESVDTEPPHRIVLAQALPKSPKLEEVIRLGTPLGIAEFVLFIGERSVVEWEMKKRDDKLRRLRTIAREAAELSFRTREPGIRFVADLATVLREYPDALVLSEVDDEAKVVPVRAGDQTLVVGPEGGWSPAELKQIGARGYTLGPRVLRTEHAGACAASLFLLSYRAD